MIGGRCPGDAGVALAAGVGGAAVGGRTVTGSLDALRGGVAARVAGCTGDAEGGVGRESAPNAGRPISSAPRGGVGRREGENGGTRGGVGDLEAAGVAERGVGAEADERACRVASSCDPIDEAVEASAEKSSVQLRVEAIGITPPHTEQRARIPGPGMRAGSTRKTDWQSGQETFMTPR